MPTTTSSFPALPHTRTPAPNRHFLPLLALLATACVSATEGEISGVAGEWCTLRGLASSGFPVESQAYAGAILLQESGRVFGSGSTKRRGESTVYSSRFSGDFLGGEVVLSVTDLADTLAVPGPTFTLRLRVDGPRDLVGSASGDPGMNGPVTLVRLGPRCFAE